MVSAVGVGNAIITVTTVDGDYTAVCLVTVYELPEVQDASVVNDPYYYKQWGLETLMIPDIWAAVTPVAEPIVVAVVDTGIDLEHEDLANRVAPGGYNFVLDNYDIYDLSGHGSAVSGIIAAETNNLKGVAGVGGTLPIQILPLQAGFYDGSMYTSDMIRAVDRAVQSKADVINISFGGSTYSAALNEAIQEAINQGIPVIASAGNDGNGSYTYPASYENVISVGSIAPNGMVSSFSNHNDQLDFAAPGELIFTTDTLNSYGFFTGTSASAPMVSGVVAIVRAVDPSLTPTDIFEVLSLTAEDKGEPGKDNYYGYGMIDPFSAVQKVIAKPVTGITLDKVTLTLVVGQQEMLVPIVSPPDAANKAVSWSSSSESVATVDPTGRVTAVGAGVATIKASTADGEFTAICKVTVIPSEEATGTIAGKVLIQGHPAENAGVTVKVEGTTPGPSTTTGDGGEFTLEGISPGTHTLGFSCPGHLVSKVDVTVTAGETATIGSEVVLCAGDVNGDNAVNLQDLTILASAYRSQQGDPSTGSRYNPTADLNEDNQVSLQDLTLLATNYRQVGD